LAARQTLRQLNEILGGEEFASKVERGAGADWIVYFRREAAEG